MQQKKQMNTVNDIDLKPYQPFGIPLLKLLFGIAVISLFVTATYEFFI
jgi:hypothetical protein